MLLDGHGPTISNISPHLSPAEFCFPTEFLGFAISVFITDIILVFPLLLWLTSLSILSFPCLWHSCKFRVTQKVSCSFLPWLTPSCFHSATLTVIPFPPMLFCGDIGSSRKKRSLTWSSCSQWWSPESSCECHKKNLSTFRLRGVPQKHKMNPGQRKS